MILLTFFIAYLGLIQDVPYKSDDEFAIRLDMKFKSRQLTKANEVIVSETHGEYDRRTNVSELPYLVLYVTINEVKNGEARIRTYRDGKVFGNLKKIEVGKEIKLEIGYTDDAKDKISGFEHILYLVNDDKKQVSKIVIRIEENGDYIVNGEKRGRV